MTEGSNIIVTCNMYISQNQQGTNTFLNVKRHAIYGGTLYNPTVTSSHPSYAAGIFFRTNPLKVY